MHEIALQNQELQKVEREKLELIKQTVAKGATDLELQLFMHACKRTGLDPLMKQIYAIKRWSSVDRREVMSFQTGIDGYRLIADRTGHYAGSSDAIFEQDVEGYPIMAQVTVMKIVNGTPCAFTASARYSEYCQTTKDGQPTSMWKKMPYLMLAKCAEALALRKAFPAELSGVYTHEEMMQADSQPHPVPQQPSQPVPPVDSQVGAQEDDLPAEPPPQTLLGNDWGIVIDDCTTIADLQNTWDQVTKDPKVTSPEKASLYKKYQAKERVLRGK